MSQRICFAIPLPARKTRLSISETAQPISCRTYAAAGKTCPVTPCPLWATTKQREGVTILMDLQGFNAMHPARAHMVYMPRDPADPNAFVSSHTGPLGGAGRQLTRGDGVFPEMEKQRRSSIRATAFRRRVTPSSRTRFRRGSARVLKVEKIWSALA